MFNFGKPSVFPVIIIIIIDLVVFVVVSIE